MRPVQNTRHLVEACHQAHLSSLTYVIRACPISTLQQVETARLCPWLNFFGAEIHRPGIGAALQGIEATGIRNLRLVGGDGMKALARWFGENSLAEILIQFPDPFERERDRPRRLLQKDNVAILETVLRKEGRLRCVTDSAVFAEHVRDILSEAGWIDITTSTHVQTLPPPIDPLEPAEGTSSKPSLNSKSEKAGGKAEVEPDAHTRRFPVDLNVSNASEASVAVPLPSPLRLPTIRPTTPYETKGIEEGRRISEVAFRPWPT